MLHRARREATKLGRALIGEIQNTQQSEQDVITSFNKLYYDSHLSGKTWAKTNFLGVGLQKCVADLWVYQEIISERTPDLIIECGTAAGGSALYLASICDLVHNGRVISIDIEGRSNLPKHDKITYLTGSSTSEEILRTVGNSLTENDRVMVILDSDHTRNHVLNELRAYGPLVTKNDYLIVEDTNINGHPVRSDFGPGPMEAVHDFLQECQDFIVDHREEQLLVTFNPRGYLKRIR